MECSKHCMILKFNEVENVIALSPDGSSILCGGGDGIIWMWGIYKDNKSSNPFWGYTGVGNALAYSPDGKILAATGSNSDDRYLIHLWDTDQMTPIGEIDLGSEDDRNIQIDDMLFFHPDGYLIFAGSRDEIRSYDLNTMEMIGDPLLTGGHKEKALVPDRMALNPEGKILAVTHNQFEDAHIALWNLETHQSIGELRLNPDTYAKADYFHSLIFSPDGQFLVCGHGGLISIWDVQNWQQVYLPLMGHENFVKHLTFSQDGKLLASADESGVIRLWDIKNRVILGVPLTGHNSKVTSLLFNADNTILFSSDVDGAIRIWDVQSQQPIGFPIQGANARLLGVAYEGYDTFYGVSGHEANITNMAISPDGRRLVSKDLSGIIRVWDMEISSWVEKVCLQAGRNLSHNEWILYFLNEGYRKTCPQYPASPGLVQAEQTSQTPVLDQPAGITRVREMDGMVEIFIPEGDFKMGSAEGDENEQPVHTVYLDAYWIDQTEVTNAQYARCVASGSCSEPYSDSSFTRSSHYYGNPDFDNHPVIYINWDQAGEYCKWAGGRLPTEAEWEKAARGKDGRTYPWGDGVPDSSLVNFYGLVGDTTVVGSYPSGASPYGALDMEGNVWEWVSDWYAEDYYSNSTLKNPGGPEIGTLHVMRGGAFYNPVLRTTKRDKASADFLNYDIGIRCSDSAMP